MAIRGVVSTMPPEDVLAWVARRRLTGAVTFERRGLVRSLVVVDGAIAWASSSRREEQLGTILARSGVVSDTALAAALTTRAETGVPLGKVLLMAGQVTEAVLVQLLTTKIREAVGDVLTWTEGSFDVIPRPQPPAIGVDAQLPIEICLTVGQRRAARLAEALAALGSDDATFFAPPSAEAPPPADGDVVDVARAWTLASERRAAKEIAAAMAGERFATFDALARLIAEGALHVDRRQRARTNSAVEVAAGARGRLREGDRAGAYALAADAARRAPDDPEVQRTYASVRRSWVAEVARTLLARHRVPRLRPTAPALDGLGLSDLEAELAARIDGRWDLVSLVHTAGGGDADALLALARLADLGVVELG